MSGKTTGAKLEREAVKRYLQQYHAAKQKKRILEDILKKKQFFC